MEPITNFEVENAILKKLVNDLAETYLDDGDDGFFGHSRHQQRLADRVNRALEEKEEE